MASPSLRQALCRPQRLHGRRSKRLLTRAQSRRHCHTMQSRWGRPAPATSPTSNRKANIHTASVTVGAAPCNAHTERTEKHAQSRVKNYAHQRTKSAKASLNSLMVSSDRSWVALRMTQCTDRHGTSHTGKTSHTQPATDWEQRRGTHGVMEGEREGGTGSPRSGSGAS